MARSLLFSNGSLHVGLDEHGRVSDFYYPRVGSENHITGMKMHHRIGIWTGAEGEADSSDGSSWLGHDWNVSAEFEETALVGQTTATNERLGIRLEFTDTVYSAANVFIRSVHVVNLRDEAREIRLFTHQLFAIGESLTNTDTAQYLPENDALLHYRGRRAFVIGGRAGSRPFDQHSIGLFGIEGHEGTFRDAEDGELGNNAVEHGRVDSVLRFALTVGAHDSARVDYWIAAGKSVSEALDLHGALSEHGVHGYIEETSAWWKKWLAPALMTLPKVREDSRRHFVESLMIVKAHMGTDGALIASTDTSMLNYARDAYAYCWPRDGALSMWPFIRLGYRDEPLAFFRFVRRVLHPGGYVMHKYFADGSLGPSWHPYVHESGGMTVTSAPIQTDETAIVVFMLAQAHAALRIKDADAAAELLHEFYDSLVLPMTDFLVGFLDEKTGLPLPSYDLWEEIFATSTYTVACTYGALCGASELADAVGWTADSLRWRTAADELKARAHDQLFNDETGYFYKSVTAFDNDVIRDKTVDSSSLYGALTFGLFDADSVQVRAAMATYRRVLVGESDCGNMGAARYEGDNYNRNDNSGAGNPWYICTMWLAQIYGRCNESDKILAWVDEGFSASGILAEQADRSSRAPLSVAPLTWSHAEYVNTMLDFLKTDGEG